MDRRIVATKADVRDYDTLKAALDDGVAQLGRLDIVSANAGIFIFGDQAHLVTEGDWRDVIDINLTGGWHTPQAAIPHLIEQGTRGAVLPPPPPPPRGGGPHGAPGTPPPHTPPPPRG